MSNYRTCILFILMGLSSVVLNAQIEQDIIRPSVNASQFGLAVKSETALSKGQVSLNIPLLELQGKGYNLPVSLAFYSGDVTFRTEASPVGLGWALMAGGVITITVKGIDDFSGYTNNEHFTNGNYLADMFSDWTNYITLTDNILIDPMPDEYTYSLPGHSGTIDVSMESGTLTRKLYPDESYKIENTGHGYCITADDGTKFYFEDAETRTAGINFQSTSWFLSRIETAIGGEFTFSYAEEEYEDLTTEDDGGYCEKFITKRITSIESDYGRIVFHSASRLDRGGNITAGRDSKRINRIELRDLNDNVVKGYELDNSGWFTYFEAPTDYYWLNYRHKLSSITQYDAAGNRLPPYEFWYSCRFRKSRRAELPPSATGGNDEADDSWTSYVGHQAYVDLDSSGQPLCSLAFPNSPIGPEGFTSQAEFYSSTAADYFCLDSIRHPNGAMEKFTYEKHTYRKVNWTDVQPPVQTIIQGRRLAAKVLYGSGLQQRTRYVYGLHDSNYNVSGKSSGVMTNPSIHCATFYTPEWEGGSIKYTASRVSSRKAYNSFMGPPVSYTEVEEIELGMVGDTISRTIHYFEPTRVSPPVNYIYIYPEYIGSMSPTLVTIENTILGTKTYYGLNMAGYSNNNYTYMAYPVGEFCDNGLDKDLPLKDVFIGRDNKVRSIREYSYHRDEYSSKFGYKMESQAVNSTNYPYNRDYTVYRISRSEYITHRLRLDGINTTSYYHNGNMRDSVCETYRLNHNKGRVSYTSLTRGNENNTTKYYFPGDILNILGNNSTPTLASVNQLIEKNIVADPIKTVIKRNGIIIGGECKDYQSVSDVPSLKSLYRIKNSDNNLESAPAVNGNEIDYKAELYKEGEILAYDENHNPVHVRINESQDRIYVWGYGGRFPIAVIDNMTYSTYNSSTNLKNKIMSLSNYRRIESGTNCNSLKTLNQEIRQLLPATAHITTYTYDPFFGMTSEMDDSNLGIIYRYDTFGRLSAKYDENYKKLEEYNYNLYLQQ